MTSPISKQQLGKNLLAMFNAGALQGQGTNMYRDKKGKPCIIGALLPPALLDQIVARELNIDTSLDQLICAMPEVKDALREHAYLTQGQAALLQVCFDNYSPGKVRDMIQVAFAADLRPPPRRVWK